MIARLIAFALLLCLAIPAQAQLTATYENPASPAGPFSMTVEIAPNGDVRGTLPGQSLWMMTIAGEGYFIIGQGKEAQVMRADDVAALLGEHMQKMMKEMMPDMPPIPDEALDIRLIEGKQVTIHGRTGTAWYMRAGDARPAVVISTDPALAPLGRAMAHQFEISTRMMAGMTLGRTGFMDGMLSILRKGAPLSFAGVELTKVSTAPIPANRFVLPAPPLSREDVRKLLEASNWQLR